MGFFHHWDNEWDAELNPNQLRPAKNYFDISGSKISHDYGQTWKDFDYFPNDNSEDEDHRRCESWSEFQFHAKGLFCKSRVSYDYDGSAISWYDSLTHTWSMHELENYAVIDSIELPEGLYLQRGNQVLQWKPSGKIAVLDDQIIVNAFGFWRFWR